MSKTMKAISLRLETDQYKRLKVLSFVNDKPVAEMIREAVEQYLITEHTIKPGQEWFWAEAWQAAEREVEEDLTAGRYETFDTLDEFFKDLK